MQIPELILMTILNTSLITLCPSKLWEFATLTKLKHHLIKAEAKLYTENEHVTAHLVPEPQNEKDSNAISVQAANVYCSEYT